MKNWFVGVFLTLIMITSLTANAFLFSARSFQHNLAELAPSSNGILDVQSFLEVETRIDAVEAGVIQERGRLLKLAADADAAADRALADSREAARLAMVAAAQIELLERAGDAPAPAPAQPAEAAAITADEPMSLVATPALQARLARVMAAGGLAADDAERLAAIAGDLERITALEASAAQNAREAEQLRLEARASNADVAHADQQILGLRASLSIDGADNFGVIRNEALAVMKSSPFGINTALVQIHPQFLSMGLVLLMGLLGGVLYLFPAYMSRDTPVTFAEIFVRMVFGMVAALAFYIVMNAAIAGFSFAPASEASAQTALNPFSVSLIGIIAGVLADDIARWIKNRGSQLLGGGLAAPAGGPALARPPAISREEAELAGLAQGPGAALSMREDRP